MRTIRCKLGPTELMVAKVAHAFCVILCIGMGASCNRFLLAFLFRVAFVFLVGLLLFNSHDSIFVSISSLSDIENRRFDFMLVIQILLKLDDGLVKSQFLKLKKWSANFDGVLIIFQR